MSYSTITHSATVAGTSETVTALMASVESGDIEACVGRIEEVLADPSIGLPRAFLLNTLVGLRSGDWSDWKRDFSLERFYNENQQLLLVCPFTASREGQRVDRLSALSGAVMDYDPVSPTKAAKEIQDIFGELRQPLTTVLPICVSAAAGLLKHESGEAFIVPNGWRPIVDGNGPALNNMVEQRRRFLVAAQCIRRIFEPGSADMVLAPLEDNDSYVQIVSDEYQLHDFGHASGIGLIEKLRHDVFRTTALGGVEEFRSDGVAFELASRLLPAERVGRMLASNLVTRLGLDAHRRGAFTDTDVNSAQLLFTCLLDAGAVRVTDEGLLQLNRSTLEGLVRSGATEVLRSQAVRLTRNELQLDNPLLVWRLYGISPNRSADVLFQQHVVNPCRGLFNNLR